MCESLSTSSGKGLSEHVVIVKGTSGSKISLLLSSHLIEMQKNKSQEVTKALYTTLLCSQHFIHQNCQLQNKPVDFESSFQAQHVKQPMLEVLDVLKIMQNLIIYSSLRREKNPRVIIRRHIQLDRRS